MLPKDLCSCKSPPSPCVRPGGANAKSVGELDDECVSVMLVESVVLVLVPPLDREFMGV